MRLSSRLKSLAGAAFLYVLANTSIAYAESLALVMVDQEGCVYCEMWKEQIGPIYPKTAEGRFAPLRIVDVFELEQSGISFARAVNFTPTFVLIEEDRELARIEGYPGEDFFWALLTRMLENNTAYPEPES